MDKETLLQALAVEREGCEQRGLADRVAQIDEQIALLSGEPQKPVARAEKRPTRRKAEER